jgi:enamine deaminase RidA (YjgF/YER057c/UK114 family)
MNTASVTSVRQRLAELGMDLPDMPRPIANFIPWKREGALLFLAGQVCEWNGRVVHKGKVGGEIDLAAAQDAARICALNLVAALCHALGDDLDRVRSCIRLGGFVNCVPDFPSVPQVINGASDVFHTLFGSEIGAHARTAIGVAQLPQNAAVEVDAVFAVH